MEYDVFICHASEDKEIFVDPLVKEMKNSGIKFWYDDFQLKVGDSIKTSIEKGMKKSKNGLIVLSHNFFKTIRLKKN